MKNILDQSPSLYLKQHADNPIHWQLWGESIHRMAKEMNRPIFISIGYSACHWCHVMAHEVFEKPQIADFLNQHFISVKIDREEYPTIDMIYQRAISLLGIQGGWPLTIFATPDGKPFWGGTYFPLHDQYGRPGFSRIISTIQQNWQDKKQDILQSADEITNAMQEIDNVSETYSLSIQHVRSMAAQLSHYLDTEHGGIGNAPKFPQSQPFELLVRYAETSHNDALPFDDIFNWLKQTFDNLCLGGLYDHIGGGFYRYATDNIWLVPHFEKMLYDNALIIDLLQHYQATNPIYKNAIHESLNFFSNEMQADIGGFYTALDADSEGEEGKFYLWDKKEVQQLLGDKAKDFCQKYHITENGNFEGKNILNRLEEQTIDADCNDGFASEKKILWKKRTQRVPPCRDEKILTDWNGLIIQTFANASMIYHHSDYLTIAQDTYDFIINNLSHQDTGLYHCYADGTAYIDGRLDDYANMILASMILYSITGKQDYITTAKKWTDHVIKNFSHISGAYHCNKTDKDMIINPISAIDNPTPSGNAIFAKTLFRLGMITGNHDYIVKSEKLINAFSEQLLKNFPSMCGLLNAYLSNQNLYCFAMMGSEREQQNAREMILNIQPRDFIITQTSILKNNATLYGYDTKYQEDLSDNDSLEIIICQNKQCFAPIKNISDLQQFLEKEFSQQA